MSSYNDRSPRRSGVWSPIRAVFPQVTYPIRRDIVAGTRRMGIEPIRLQGSDCYRVRHHGYLVRYCTSLRELEELLRRHGIELGDLREVEDC